MKKFLLLLTIISATLMANSQSFTVSKNVVNVEGPNSTSEDALSTITNVSTDMTDTAFQWAIISLSAPAQWLLSFCDIKDCYTSLGIGMNKVFYLKNAASGPLKATFDFQNMHGSGSFAIVVSSVKNPTDMDTVTFNANAWLTSVNEVKNQKSIVVYPNPVRDQLNIQYQAKDRVNIEIYNLLGSKVKSFTNEALNNTVHVGDLDKGIYFIRINDKNTIYTKSFTKID